MGYDIEAFVAPEPLLIEHRSAFRNAYVVPLAQGFALLPLINALVKEIDPHPRPGDDLGTHGFHLLTPAVAAWAERVSRDGPIAYFEAGYFGGLGSQRAVVWKGGRLEAGPLDGRAIDQALQLLGVERSPGDDEFDTIGLGRRRRTERWAADAIADEFQGRPGGAVAGLVEALRFEHDDPSLKNLVRAVAADRLGELGPAAREALPAMLRSARTDADYSVRLNAACALAGIGPEAVASLVDLLGTEGADHWPAAFALSKLGPAARDAVPALVRVLGDPDYRARSQAAETLGEIGPGAREAVAALSAALTDPEWPVRSHAARALGEIGPDARAALPALQQAAADANEHVRQAAAEALARFDPSGAPDHSE